MNRHQVPSFDRLERRADPTHSGVIERPCSGSSGWFLSTEARASRPTQPSRRPIAMGVAIAVSSLAALLLLVGATLASIDDGRTAVHVEVMPQDAALSLDGWPVEGQSPFVLSGVEPRQRHILSLRRAGYRAWHAEITLQPGETLHLPSVQLVPERR